MKFLLLGIRGLHYFGRIVHKYEKNGTRLETLYRKKNGKSNFFSPFLSPPNECAEKLCDEGVDFLEHCLYTQGHKNGKRITFDHKNKTFRDG